jgi:hypothetical protein
MGNSLAANSFPDTARCLVSGTRAAGYSESYWPPVFISSKNYSLKPFKPVWLIQRTRPLYASAGLLVRSQLTQAASSCATSRDPGFKLRAERVANRYDARDPRRGDVAKGEATQRAPPLRIKTGADSSSEISPVICGAEKLTDGDGTLIELVVLD